MANVAVYCGSAPGADAYDSVAGGTGRALAAAGHTLVWGGQTLSLMGVVARSVRRHGGRTVGVIPDYMMTLSPDIKADEFIVVDSLSERKRRMREISDACVVLPGGVGTLDELFSTWAELYVGEHSKPMIILDPDGSYDALFDWMDSLVATGLVSKFAGALPLRVSTPLEAMTVLESRQATNRQEL